MPAVSDGDASRAERGSADRAMQRGEECFLTLQHAARDWISLDGTKTGIVYRLNGGPLNAHE